MAIAELFIILVILALAILPLALFVWALIDLLKFDDSSWESIGQNTIVWLLVVILVGCLGPALYYFMARPKLLAVQQRS